MAEDTRNLESWLTSIGLQKYAELFRENAIDLDIISEINNPDLVELGIPLGDRKRLLVSIKTFGGQHRVAGALAGPTASTLTDAEKFVERRQVTVLFCDLVGSTALSSRLDPEDLNDVIRTYQMACDSVVKQFDGYTGNYLGDGILAYFGWPVAHEDDARRAVLAGFAMTDATQQIVATDGTVLAARVGIATGLVLVGEQIGEGVAQQETVVGATPNIAAKIQSFAKAGKIVIADSTRELLGNIFEFTDLGEYEIDGADSKIRVWNVDSMRAGNARMGAETVSQQHPLVGRTAEMERFTGLWRRASQGTGNVLMVTGEAGVGKSKLVQAFRDDLKNTPLRTIELQCSSFHANASFYPIIEGLRSLHDLAGDDPTAAVSLKLESALETAGIPIEPAAPLLAALLGSDAYASGPVPSLSPQMRRDKTIDAAVKLIASNPDNLPMLVIVEDVHWIDPSTVDVLNRLIAQTKSTATLIVLTARSGSVPAVWQEHTGIETLNVTALGNEQVRDLILQHSGGHSLPDDAISAILSHTDGVPLFVEELTKTLIESGQLKKTNNGYELKDSLPQLTIPTTLQASLLARLDRLPSAKPIAQAGATIGRSFPPDLLEHVVGLSGEVISAQLSELCKLGILATQGGGNAKRYQFTHALMQDAAYQSQLKARRREIHAEIADALTGPFSDLPENRPEVLAHHLAEAGETEHAIGEYLRAGRQAIHASAVKEANAHLNGGLRLLRTLPQSNYRDLLEMRLQASIGTSLMLEKGWASEQVQHAYARASTLSVVTEDRHEKLWILWGAWVSRHVRGRVFEAQTLCDQIRSVADEDGSADALLIADMISLQAAFYSGRFDRAIEFADSMRRRFRPDRHRALVDLYSTDLEIVAMVHQAIALCAIGRTCEGLRLRALAEERARSIDHKYTICWSLVWGATAEMIAGDLQGAGRLAREALPTATAQGYDYVVSLAKFYLAYIGGREDDDGSSVQEMYQALDEFRSTGAEIAVPHFLTLIASILVQLDRPEDALTVLDRAQAQVELHGEAWQESEIHRTRATALQKLDEHDPAAIEVAFEKSIDLAASQGADGWRWRSIVDKAEYLISVNCHDAADSMLQDVILQNSRHKNCTDYLKAEKIMLSLQEGSPGRR